jgi:hypothetical protein
MTEKFVDAADLNDATGGEATEARPMPVITVTGDLAKMSTASWAALVEANTPPKYFRHGSELIRIEPGARPDDPPRPRTLDVRELRHELARVAHWQVIKDRTPRPCHPPVAVVQDMLAAPTFPVPPLLAITPTPLVVADGTIVNTPGYHATSAIYYAPSRDFVVPAIPTAPTEEQVAAARDQVTELFRDFPFAEPADRANAWAALLTIFVRELIPEPTPLFMLTKPAPGTGATLLVQALSTLALGSLPESKMLPGEEEEARKTITATLRAAPRMVLLDNLTGFLDSAALSSALTALVWSDRVLGKTEDVHFPVRCVWFGTSNNATWTTELGRRFTPIRLDAQLEKPWERSGFAHPDLLEWIKDHRASLIHACLTVVAAWLAKGRPDGTARHGSYARWSKVQGGILEAAGINEFLKNLDRMYEEADAERDELAGFLAAWWAEHGETRKTPTELLEVADKTGLSLNGKDDAGRARSLGWYLRKHKDRTIEIEPGLNVRIRRVPDRNPLWRLERSAGLASFAGFSHNPPRESGRGNDIEDVYEEKTCNTSTTRDRHCTRCNAQPAKPGFNWCPECFKANSP